MLKFIYTTLFYLSLPIIYARLWWRGKKVPSYRDRWKERLGYIPTINTEKPVLWIHAVSVGETIAATPLVFLILESNEWEVLITTTTPTGSAQVKKTFGGKVKHCFAPYDLPLALNNFLKRSKPKLCVIMETELWPNTLRACKKKGIPTVIANARLSEKSAEGYARFAKTTKSMLSDITTVAAQYTEDGDRFIKLGLRPEQLQICGNIKFDITISNELVNQAKELKNNYSANGQRQIIIAASTHEGEDEIILHAFRQVLAKSPRCILILVPRHPDRFDSVYALCAHSFKTLRRSQNIPPDADTQIICGDTMGELMLLYGVSDIAFIGGSLIERGGHNMIEAAYWGLPIISGPHVFNFANVAQSLFEHKALRYCGNSDELFDQFENLLNNEHLRVEAGQNALNFALENRGALQKLYKLSTGANN